MESLTRLPELTEMLLFQYYKDGGENQRERKRDGEHTKVGWI